MSIDEEGRLGLNDWLNGFRWFNGELFVISILTVFEQVSLRRSGSRADVEPGGARVRSIPNVTECGSLMDELLESAFRCGDRMSCGICDCR